MTITTKSGSTTRWFTLLLLVFCGTHTYQKEEGDPCTVQPTGLRGTCKISSECPVVQQQAENGIQPTICGFIELTVPIVCCENEIKGPRPNENTLLVTDDNGNGNGNQETSEFVFPDDSVRKSEQKCEEYNKLVTGVIQAISLTPVTEAISINVAKCDYNSVALIVGGKPATPGEFPFMAAIGLYRNNAIEWMCGGTLISEDFVLTAAHCTFSRDGGNPELVRMGELDLENPNNVRRSDFNITRIIAHPGYRYPQKYNDIALLQLSRRVEFSKNIRPACLFTGRSVEADHALATGWGKTDFAAGEMSSKLMKVSLKIYDNRECERSYEDKKRLPQGIINNMICAGELEGGKDTCQGDSGGPLLIQKKGNQCQFYIIGITSFGKSCGQVNTAAVYTKVSEFVSWIEDNVW